MVQVRFNEYVLVRADANSKIGLGHIMRCLTLCEKLKRCQHKPLMIIKDSEGRIPRLLQKERIGFITIPKNLNLETEAERIVRIIKEYNSSKIIFDSYSINGRYLNRIAACGVKILMLDDRNYIFRPNVDYLVNANSFATQINYKLNKKTNPFFGESYYILDKAYACEKSKDIRREVKTIALCLSGAYFEVFMKLAKFLLSHSHSAVKIYFSLFQRSFVKKMNRLCRENDRLLCYFNLSEKKLARELQNADLAIVSGGTIMYKAIAAGCAVLALPVVKEQDRNIRSLEQKGCALKISINEDGLSPTSKGRITNLLDNFDRRKKMVSAGIKLLDGKGAERVAQIICVNNY